MSLPVTHRGIIVGVDGSSVSKLAVEWAARDAAMRNIALTMVNVQDPPMLLTEPNALHVWGWYVDGARVPGMAAGCGTRDPQ